MSFFISLLFWLTNFNKGINKVRINNVLQTLVWSVVIMHSILDLHVIMITKIKNMFIACAYNPIYHTALFQLWAVFFRLTIKFHLNKWKMDSSKNCAYNFKLTAVWIPFENVNFKEQTINKTSCWRKIVWKFFSVTKLGIPSPCQIALYNTHTQTQRYTLYDGVKLPTERKNNKLTKCCAVN